jgi:hypothetical protein
VWYGSVRTPVMRTVTPMAQPTARGLDQNIGLVLAKAVLGLVGEGVDYRALVRDAVLFGARNRDGWGIGLTILTALGNLIASLPEEACDPAASSAT